MLKTILLALLGLSTSQANAMLLHKELNYSPTAHNFSLRDGNVDNVVSNLSWHRLQEPLVPNNSTTDVPYFWFRLDLPEHQSIDQVLYIKGFGFPFYAFMDGKLIYQHKTVDDENTFYGYPWHIVELPRSTSKFIYIFASFPRSLSIRGFFYPLEIIPKSEIFKKIINEYLRTGFIGLFAIMLGILGFFLTFFLKDKTLILSFSAFVITSGIWMISNTWGPSAKFLIYENALAWSRSYQISLYFFPVFLLLFYKALFIGSETPTYYFISRILPYLHIPWLVPLGYCIIGRSFPISTFIMPYTWFCLVCAFSILLDCWITYPTSDHVQRFYIVGIGIFIFFCIYSVLCAQRVLPDKWCRHVIDWAILFLIIISMITTVMRISAVEVSNVKLSHELEVSQLLLHDIADMTRRLNGKVHRMLIGLLYRRGDDSFRDDLSKIGRWSKIVLLRSEAILLQDSSQKNIPRDTFSLKTSIADSIDRSFLFEEDHDIKIFLNLNHQLMVSNSRAALDSILDNLIGNAKKALKKAGKRATNKTIEFTSSIQWIRNQAYIVVGVRNNHCSITEEQRKHLYKPRPSNSYSPNGYGLTIVKHRVIENMNGEIIQPTVNRNNRTIEFSFRIPTYTTKCDDAGVGHNLLEHRIITSVVSPILNT